MLWGKLGCILQVVIALILAIIIALIIFHFTNPPKPAKSTLPTPSPIFKVAPVFPPAVAFMISNTLV